MTFFERLDSLASKLNELNMDKKALTSSNVYVYSTPYERARKTKPFNQEITELEQQIMEEFENYVKNRTHESLGETFWKKYIQKTTENEVRLDKLDFATLFSVMNVNKSLRKYTGGKAEWNKNFVETILYLYPLDRYINSYKDEDYCPQNIVNKSYIGDKHLNKFIKSLRIIAYIHGDVDKLCTFGVMIEGVAQQIIDSQMFLDIVKQYYPVNTVDKLVHTLKIMLTHRIFDIELKCTPKEERESRFKMRMSKSSLDFYTNLINYYNTYFNVNLFDL